MAERATFSLDKEAYTFLNKVAGKNRSAYINALLNRERLKVMEDAILQANIEEAEDQDYQQELSDWDATLADGLNP